VSTALLVAGLILAGAVAHASWNLVVKRSAVSGPTFVWLSVVATAVLMLPVAVVAAVLVPPSWADLAVAVAVAGLLHVGYFLTLQAGYREGDVSVVYPLARGTGPLLSVLLAIPLLGESPPLLGLLGAGAVVVGVVVIGLAGGRANWASARAGVLWGLLVGVFIAGYTLWDARAVTVLAISPILLHAGTNVVEAALLAPLAARRWSAVRTTVRDHWREVLVVAVLSPLAYLLILFALQLAPVAIVAPAREISVVFVGLAGWLLFREPHPGQRLTGSAIVLGGIALLAVAR
jgi:drug/metabolite transporter (DMT)-like permease